MKQNKDREEFVKLWLHSLMDSSNNRGDKLWSWFQSKQQEKIERVKKLKRPFGVEYYGLVKLSDVLKIMEE